MGPTREEILAGLDTQSFFASRVPGFNGSASKKYPCPLGCSDDRDPATTVWIDKQSWRCFRCEEGGSPFDLVMKQDGIDFKEAVPVVAAFSSTNGSTATKPTRKRVHTYQYADENLEPLFQVVRYEPKDFRQERWIESDQKYVARKGCMDGCRLVLYGLRSVIDANENFDTVYVCEGEKDADALISIDLCGTTAPGGAGKWRPEYSKVLASATVVIVADDDPAGHGHARLVRASVEGLVESVTIVKAREGKDAFDHVAAGFGASDFVPLDLPAMGVHEEARPAVLHVSSGDDDGSGWDDPIPLGAMTCEEEFDVSLLPSWLAEFINEVSAKYQVPTCLPALAALSTISSTLAGKVKLNSGAGGWVEEPMIWSLVIMESGAGKSGPFKRCIAPLQAIEFEEAERLEDPIKEAIKAQRRARLRVTHLEGIISRGGTRNTTQEQAEDQLAMADRELDDCEIPRPVQHIASEDITPESIPDALDANEGTLAILTDEAGEMFDMTGRYSQTTNFTNMLRGWDCTTIRVNRRNREVPLIVREPRLTISGTMQPYVIYNLRERPEFKLKGWTGRLLWAMPKNMVGLRDLTPYDLSDQTRAMYSARIRALSEVERASITMTIPFDPAATEVFQEFRAWLEPRLLPGARFTSIKEWAAKMGSHVIRLAGALHAAELPDAGALYTETISAATVERAVALIKGFFAPHAMHSIAGTQPPELVRPILEFCKRSLDRGADLPDSLSAMRRAMTPGLGDPEEFRTALHRMEQDEICRCVDGARRAVAIEWSPKIGKLWEVLDRCDGVQRDEIDPTE